MSEAFFLLTFLTLQRLLELVISRHNTKKLLAKGAKEFGSQHYIYMILLHGSWIVLLWILGGQNEVSTFWLAIFVILQFARFWVLMTLKSRWTTRIIVPPNADLVEHGPFRYVRHPNYWVVVGEIAVVPMALGLIWVAIIYTVLNAWMLWVRIGVENDALIGPRP